MNTTRQGSRVSALSRLLRRRMLGVSLRVKTVGAAIVTVLLLGTAITLQVRAYLAQDLRRSLEERGVAIARGLAARSTDLILTDNRFALHELIRETFENNPDVRYAFILAPDGEVLAHSFGVSVPPDLLRVNQVAADAALRQAQDTVYQVETLHSDEGLIRDVAAPILAGRAGVARVGLTERRLEASIARAVGALLITTAGALLLGLLAAYLLARIMTQPVQALVEATRVVARGDLQHQAPRYADDEIGELADAFNAMTQALAQSQAALLRHNRELTALNAVIVATSHSQDLEAVLTAALEKTLQVVGAPAGWIVLPEGGRTAIVAYHGLTHAFVERENAPDAESCLCLEAMAAAAVTRLPEVRRDCPRLARARALEQSDLACHLSIPLQVKERVVGMMNIAVDPATAALPAQDLPLLTAIGQQVGVAVENAQLWRQVRQKEAQRGQLLEKLITAQEDERRRIARELHDEAGSSLTSLLLGLKLLEEGCPTPEIRGKVAELKEISAHTLEGLRRLSAELRPAALDRLGLIPALEQMAHEFSQRTGVAAHFQALGFTAAQLLPHVESHLYRIVQEALTNVARHAGASTVGVLLERRADAVVLVVEDDGRGFVADRALASNPDGHLGLAGMRERAALLGGRLTVESAPGQGATLFVEIPHDKVEGGGA